MDIKDNKIFFMERNLTLKPLKGNRKEILDFVIPVKMNSDGKAVSLVTILRYSLTLEREWQMLHIEALLAVYPELEELIMQILIIIYKEELSLNGVFGFGRNSQKLVAVRDSNCIYNEPSWYATARVVGRRSESIVREILSEKIDDEDFIDLVLSIRKCKIARGARHQYRILNLHMKNKGFVNRHDYLHLLDSLLLSKLDLEMTKRVSLFNKEQIEIWNTALRKNVSVKEVAAAYDSKEIKLLYYTRYGDQFLFGLRSEDNGMLKDSFEGFINKINYWIKEAYNEPCFLLEDIKLSYPKEGVIYLGYRLEYQHHNVGVEARKEGLQGLFNEHKMLVKIPFEELFEVMISVNIMIINGQIYEGLPISDMQYLSFKEILKAYRDLYWKICGFYHNIGLEEDEKYLERVVSQVLMDSLAKTLILKFDEFSNTIDIYNKFGYDLININTRIEGRINERKRHFYSPFKSILLWAKRFGSKKDEDV